MTGAPELWHRWRQGELQILASRDTWLGNGFKLFDQRNVSERRRVCELNMQWRNAPDADAARALTQAPDVSYLMSADWLDDLAWDHFQCAFARLVTLMHVVTHARLMCWCRTGRAGEWQPHNRCHCDGLAADAMRAAGCTPPMHTSAAAVTPPPPPPLPQPPSSPSILSPASPPSMAANDTSEVDDDMDDGAGVGILPRGTGNVRPPPPPLPPPPPILPLPPRPHHVRPPDASPPSVAPNDVDHAASSQAAQPVQYARRVAFGGIAEVRTYVVWQDGDGCTAPTRVRQATTTSHSRPYGVSRLGGKRRPTPAAEAALRDSDHNAQGRVLHNPPPASHTSHVTDGKRRESHEATVGTPPPSAQTMPTTGGHRATMPSTSESEEAARRAARHLRFGDVTATSAARTQRQQVLQRERVRARKRAADYKRQREAEATHRDAARDAQAESGRTFGRQESTHGAVRPRDVDESMERDLRHVLDAEAAEAAVADWRTLATAHVEQARAAYRRLARRLHPDKLASEEATAMMQALAHRRSERGF